MYNLIVTADNEAWHGEPYSMPRSRVFEYTEDAITARFQGLDEEQLQRLYGLPTIFAFENGVGQDARVGRVNRVRIRNRDVQIEYEFTAEASPIPHQLLGENSRELDVGDWEMNRTHWAIKDVDLAPFLQRHEIIRLDAEENAEANQPLAELPIADPIPIRPVAFRMPAEPVDPRLVSVMMPFTPEFDGMFAQVRGACDVLGLTCRNAGEIWENEEIIQDIFSLIFRSRVVVCDFSGQNANVFYEAGIAHTLGKPVIPIAQSIDDLPFDLRHHRAAVYQNTEQGLARLAEQLRTRLQWLVERG